MRKVNAAFSKCKFLLLVISVFFLKKSNAQLTLNTEVPTGVVYVSDTEPGVLIFGVRNTNSSPIVITAIDAYLEPLGAGTYTLWYHPTAVTGTPPPVTTTDGWVQLTPSATVSPSSNGVIPILSGLNLSIPANTTYRLALQGPAHGPYYGVSGSTSDLFSGGGLLIYAQGNVNSPTYAGIFPSLSSTFTPRSFYGSITFSPANTCTDPPVAGTAISSLTNACGGTPITLDLSGNSIGTGQTYQWQSSTDNTTWSNVGSSSNNPVFNTTMPGASTYYRCAVTCGLNTSNSASVLVTYNGAPVSGNFTINNNAAPSATNFQTFAAAIASLSCGISGPVTFTVDPASGPYIEQVTIPVINGSSAVNTVTFNGNGRTLSFSSSTTGAREGILLDGADYITINNLVIDGSTGNYGWGVRLTNGADNNTISNCSINVSTSITTSANHVGIVFSNSATSATSSGNNGNNNLITGNTIKGGYYGISCYGNSSAGAQTQNNTIANNIIQDVYTYSVYMFYQSGAIVSANNISRPTRTNSTTCGGVYISTGCINTLVEKNQVHNMFDGITTSTSSLYGIYISADGASGQENKLYNNLIYNTGGNGTVYGIYNTAAPFMKAYHNTISLDDQSATSGSAYGFYQTSAATDIDFRNNIISVTRSGTGTKRCLYFLTTTSAIISNKNVLYMNAASGTNNNVGQFGSTNYATLTNWQTANASAYDQQSISLDPLFLAPLSGNYTPGEALINNIGDNVGVLTDILNNPRIQITPDPGAFEFGGITLCTDPPTPGTLETATNPVCWGANFSMNVVGGTVGLGQTYQWQSSPDGLTWTDIAGATNASVTVSQLTDTYYRLAITCGTSTVYTDVLQVTTQICYCTSIPSSTADTEIYGVSINGTTNSSDCSIPAPGAGSILTRYSNYYPLGAITALLPGSSVPFSVVIDDCTPTTYYSSGCSVWIDFNRDGDFEDAGEQVYVDNATVMAPRTITGNIDIPANAVPGITGMRVIVAESNSGNALQPCMTYTYGETEDYLVNIISPIPCTGMPIGGTIASNKTTVCAGEGFLLTSSGATSSVGITYQWQSSPDNSVWTDIPGATNISYSTSQLATTYYRLAVTCTNGGTVAYSNVVNVISPVLVTGTYTINNGQPTSGTNFQSFNDAYNFLKCGIGGPVVFNVDPASGPYTEQLIIDPVFGASDINTITFNGNGRIIQFTSTNTNERAVIKLNGADHFIFDSLTINATATTSSDYGFGVQLLNDADSNVFRKCIINVTSDQTSTNHVGISISASATSATTTGNSLCDNNLFEGNLISGGYYGITNYGSSSVANQRNKFIKNTIKDFYLYGIYSNGTFQTIIEGNDISRPTRTVLSTGTSGGITFTGLSTGVKVNGNFIHDMLGGDVTSTNDVYGIYFTGVDALSGLDNIVSNNLIYNIRSNGTIYGLYNAGSDNVFYFHNTISLEDVLSTTTEATRGFYQTTVAAGIILKNNIFTLNRGGTGAVHGLYFNTPTSVIESDYNDIFFVPPANGFFGYNGSDQVILADWQLATGQDANSVSNDPLYIDPLNVNYKPTNAVIDDIGTPVGISTDILGLSRSATTPDIGAYEFVPPPCVSPPTAGTATVSQTPVCENFFVGLGAIDYSIGSGQTYQWQVSTDIAGPWANISGALNSPSFTITASETLYYRVAVTCSGLTEYSVPVLLTVTPALPAGTYTIDPTQPSSATNFMSFTEAKNAMACGIAGPIVINVEPVSTPYLEQLLMDSIPGTSDVNTITFNGAGATIKYSSSTSTDRAVIRLNGTDYVTFNNLIIDATGTGTYGWGVWLTNGADSNAFNNCTVNITASSTSTNFAGIVISGSATAPTSTTASYCDGNVFNGNVVTGGYYGMTMLSSSAASISNNKFINNQVRDFYSYGIYVGNTTNALVENNLVTRPTRSAVTTHYGIYCGGTTNFNLRVLGNRITDPTGGVSGNTSSLYAIYNPADGGGGPGQQVTVANNLIDNFNGGGTIYAIYNLGGSNISYYHNTISLDNTANSTTNVTRGIYFSSAVSGVEIKNNIITITRGGTGTKHAIYLGSTSAIVVSDKNDLYVDPASSSSYVGYLSSNQKTLANWQTATSQDANSFSIDPIYTNPGAGDFTPLLGVIDNVGEPVGILTDINNVTRSLTTPDIGAFEFSIIPCTEPPVAGTSVANPSSGICLGTIINLELTGNTTGGFQKYIWQYGPTATGPWESISDTLYSAIFNYELTSYANTFFRAVVICGSSTDFSTPVQITLNPALIGDYTIDPSIPTGATNFQTFVEAANALQCGIAGPVRFLAVPGTYAEHVVVRKVPGASAINTVTFMSQNGDPTSVDLTYNATDAGNNFVVRLDSADHIIFKNISITPTGTTYGHAVEIAGTSSSDSILNNIIVGIVSTSTSEDYSAIYGTSLRGSGVVIKGNTITSGTTNIYLSGVANVSNGFVIDSNILSNSYYRGIYVSGIYDINVAKNVVSKSGIQNTTVYGIYLTNCDSAYQVNGNKVTIENTGTTVYAIYLTGCAAQTQSPASVSNNRIVAVNNITSTLYGLYQSSSENNYTVNNVIDVKSSGATVRGLYSSAGGGLKYYNNTVRNASTSGGTNNVAAYFSQSSGTSGVTDIRNNVFTHTGGGLALYQGNTGNIYSDYNMYYSSGSILIRNNTVNLPTLQNWRDETDWDQSSIAYMPAFVTGNNNLEPDVANPDVWAMHGRGVQIADNATDINGNPRPTTLTSGVPDLGAYEFLPTVNPPALPATPASPAAGTTQVFMFGTDTVQKISWAPASTVPGNIEVRRYSGIIPPGLATGQQSMYFYTDVDYTGTAPTNFELKQFYINSWLRNIPSEATVKMGRTDASAAWIVSSTSPVDTFVNVITESNLNFLDKFTGMTDGQAPPPPPPPPSILTVDSSNKGRRFWVGYANSWDFFSGSNSQNLVLYLSADDQPANVTVKVNGTNWVRNYSIPANTVISSNILPKSGLSDARLLYEGFSPRGISIESDIPITAYAHIYSSTNSGATMLLPVGTYGYEYYTLNSRQNYTSTNSHSSFFVIADRDSTYVEITPSNPTFTGHAANTPFTVMLNKGEIYQILGAYISGAEGYDMTGSVIKSIPNASGKCYPIAVFAGSTRTALGCGTSAGGTGDVIFQQIFPSQAWGLTYLTAPTSVEASAGTFMTNIFRVMVKDPTTAVTLNGSPLSGLINNRYYQFESNTTNIIQADKPVLVAQYMSSSGSCPGTSGDGDPEMFYLSPVEQSIKYSGFYRNNLYAIDENYLTLIIPTAGLSSLTIDGSSTFTYTTPHTAPGYSVVVQRWTSGSGQSVVQSDSAFTGIVYGLGSVESYGYNVGTLVKNLSLTQSFANVFSSNNTSQYTCKGTPFRMKIQVSLKPTQILWQLSQFGSLNPNADILQTNPVASDSIVVNGRKYYIYELDQDYTFTATGTYFVPITIYHPDIEGCNNSIEVNLPIEVLAAPKIDFTTAFSGCLGDAVQFNGPSTTLNGNNLNQWTWDFGDGNSSMIQNPTNAYVSAGTYNVHLTAIGDDGCVSDTTKQFNASPLPTVAIVEDTVYVCNNDNATFTVQNPVSGATYNWYNATSGGTLLGTGTSFILNNVTGTTKVFLEGIVGGCTSAFRDSAYAAIKPTLATPVVIVDSLDVTFILFRWNAVSNATGYEVSTDNGATWFTPSSGSTGLTHLVSGLTVGTTITLQVRALGGCLPAISAAVSGTTRTDMVYIPNAFTPNGDGRNDVLRVYSNVIRSMKFVVFNQWGEKIHESSDPNLAWDGTYKGKPQPSGVYIYVAEMIINTGEKIQRKGAINLVR